MFQRIGHHEAEKIFSKLAVVSQISKSNFGFNHPELRSMTTGIGVFGPEGGTEGIDIGKGRGKELGLQLAADSQAGLCTKKIIVPGDARVSHRWIFRIKRRHTEHFSSTLTIVGGDDRRMHMHETPFLKERVHSMADTTADTKNSTVGVGSGPQMGDRAQELEAMTFFLQGEALIDVSIDKDLITLDFPTLTRPWRRHHLAADTDTGTGP